MFNDDVPEEDLKVDDVGVNGVVTVDSVSAAVVVTADDATIPAVTSRKRFKQIQQYVTTENSPLKWTLTVWSKVKVNLMKMFAEKYCFTVIDPTGGLSQQP